MYVAVIVRSTRNICDTHYPWLKHSFWTLIPSFPTTPFLSFPTTRMMFVNSFRSTLPIVLPSSISLCVLIVIPRSPFCPRFVFTLAARTTLLQSPRDFTHISTWPRTDKDNYDDDDGDSDTMPTIQHPELLSSQSKSSSSLLALPFAQWEEGKKGGQWIKQVGNANFT